MAAGPNAAKELAADKDHRPARLAKSPFVMSPVLLVERRLEQRGEHVAAKRRELEAGRRLIAVDDAGHQHAVRGGMRDAGALPIGSGCEAEQEHALLDPECFRSHGSIRFGSMFSFRVIRHHSHSMMRVAAGASGFFTLTQSAHGPELIYGCSCSTSRLRCHRSNQIPQRLQPPRSPDRPPPRARDYSSRCLMTDTRHCRGHSIAASILRTHFMSGIWHSAGRSQHDTDAKRPFFGTIWRLLSGSLISAGGGCAGRSPDPRGLDHAGGGIGTLLLVDRATAIVTRLF